MSIREAAEISVDVNAVFASIGLDYWAKGLRVLGLNCAADAVGELSDLLVS